MTAETDTTTGASGDASQTEMETITLNNRTITVPKEAAAILKEAESNLMSGYQAKLTKEREETRQKLAEDTEWYSTHPQDAWADYDPKVHGGKGYTGDESKLTARKTETATATNGTKTSVSFGDDMRVKQLERELDETKKAVEYLQTSDMRRGSNQVAEIRDNLLKKYPYADADAVTESLRLFWVNNQRHPAPPEIESIVKKRNDFVAVKVANAQQGMIHKQTATPTVIGTSPLSKKDKLPPLEDVDAWIKLAREDMAVR